MRIVSGKFRSRQINFPKSDKTRPTTDKVRESLFNVIGPYFEGGQALDLFAGSGSLGLESLSRGIDSCVFVDQDFQAINTIKSNLKTLGLEQQVIKSDYKSALSMLKGTKFDIIFLDPPYAKEEVYLEVINFMLENQMLNEGALIICEHKNEVKIETNLEIYSQKKYGITTITIYEV